MRIMGCDLHARDDAMAEGFSSREELLLDLRKYYPKAIPNDPVTVISFQPQAQTGTLFST